MSFFDYGILFICKNTDKALKTPYPQKRRERWKVGQEHNAEQDGILCDNKKGNNAELYSLLPLVWTATMH
jgi:hypothetical protein